MLSNELLIDRDFLLNIIIFEIYQTELSEYMIFKWGTALKKVFFDDSLLEYRFSKDLDFTIKKNISPKSLNNFVDKICNSIKDKYLFDFWRIGGDRPKDGEYWIKSYSITIKLKNPSWIFSVGVRVKFDFKIEPNFTKDYKKHIIKNYYKGNEAFEDDIPCYTETIENIFRWKMEALFWKARRTEVKDFFDIVNILYKYWNSFDYKKIINSYNIDLHFKRLKIIQDRWEIFFKDQLNKTPSIEKIIHWFERFFQVSLPTNTYIPEENKKINNIPLIFKTKKP